MSFQVFRILDGNELTRVLSVLSGQKFVDGKLTSTGPARDVKNNLQAERATGEPNEADQIVLTALKRSQVLQSFAFARRIMLPLFNRYENGMEYGSHVDSARKSCVNWHWRPVSVFSRRMAERVRYGKMGREPSRRLS